MRGCDAACPQAPARAAAGWAGRSPMRTVRLCRSPRARAWSPPTEVAAAATQRALFPISCWLQARPMIASDFRDAPQELTRFAARAQPPTGRHRAFGQKLRAASSVRISADRVGLGRRVLSAGSGCRRFRCGEDWRRAYTLAVVAPELPAPDSPTVKRSPRTCGHAARGFKNVGRFPRSSARFATRS